MRSEDGVQVTLSPGFFMMTGDSIVPLESDIVHKLRRSPLSLDLYAWLSYRLFRLKEETIHRLEITRAAVRCELQSASGTSGPSSR